MGFAMNKLAFLLLFLVISGCTFIEKSYKYNQICQDAIHNILQENYDEAIASFATYSTSKDKIDKLRTGLKDFNKILKENFGDTIRLSFIGSSKTFSTKEDEPDITTLNIQIENDTRYGNLKFTINDEIGKIDFVNLTDSIKVIPDTTLFWLFGIFPAIVLAFNIYTIMRIVRSSYSRKWLLIFCCIILNGPAINCLIQYPRLNINLEYTLQLLLGIAFNFMGYDNYSLTFALPMGAFLSLYAIWRSKRRTLIPESS